VAIFAVEGLAGVGNSPEPRSPTVDTLVALGGREPGAGGDAGAVVAALHGDAAARGRRAPPAQRRVPVLRRGGAGDALRAGLARRHLHPGRPGRFARQHHPQRSRHGLGGRLGRHHGPARRGAGGDVPPAARAAASAPVDDGAPARPLAPPHRHQPRRPAMVSPGARHAPTAARAASGPGSRGALHCHLALVLARGRLAGRPPSTSARVGPC
jgi:hypothetical protein